jgi:hypothetical protein
MTKQKHLKQKANNKMGEIFANQCGKSHSYRAE